MRDERISKIIANAGIVSRRKAEELIVQGHVKVNGKVVRELGVKANPSDDIIQVQGKEVKRPRRVYIALNKPRGYVSTKDDPQERKTVFDLLPQKYRDIVHNVGRLDKETSGLLLFTNDGSFTHKITHPKFRLKKKYQVSLRGKIQDEYIEKLKAGFEHPDFAVSPCTIEQFSYNAQEDKTRFTLTIAEGKNREIRKIFEFFGYELLRLHRVQIGGFHMYTIKMGLTRVLSPHDVRVVLKEDTGEIKAGKRKN